MDFLTDFLKIYGPMAIGWVLAVYLIKFVLDRYQADIEARVSLANALDGLTRVIEGFSRGGNGTR